MDIERTPEQVTHDACPRCGRTSYQRAQVWCSHCGVNTGEVEYVRADFYRAGVEITDAMCAAALAAERSTRWNSDELRIWAMLAAARDVARGRVGDNRMDR